MDKQPSDGTPVPIMMETRMKTKRDSLIGARDQLRLQLNGIENQIYIIEQLLNPQPEEADSEKPVTGVPMGDGTV